MAERLVNVDRQTPMLLPVDLREWVPEDDLVHFVIETVNSITIPALKVNRSGSGSAQYPPRMMLALLIYCYAQGIFSSRRIERATWRDIGVRYLTGDTHPDHDTIAAFRRNNFEAMSQAFVEVLRLARQMGVLKVGKVSVDGTHIRASASKNRNVRYDRAKELEAQLEADVKELLAKAEEADCDERDDGQRLPKEIAHRERLRQKIAQARADLERQAKEQAERERAERELADRERAAFERKNKEKQPDEEGGSDPPAPPPRKSPPKSRRRPPRKPIPRDEEQVNLTDTESRLMRKSKRSGYEQCYNAQAVVDAEGSQLVLAGHVSQCASDANELEKAIEAVPAEAGEVSAVLADSGYVNVEAWDRLESQGKSLYIAVGREENRRRYDFRPRDAVEKPPREVKDPRLLAMREKLRSDEGRAIYSKRKQTVEPVFGIMKHVMGFRQFLLRGVEKVSGEWSLVSLAYNMKRLHALKAA